MGAARPSPVPDDRHGLAQRRVLAKAMRASTDTLVSLCQQLVRIDSQNPPGDTRHIARFIEERIGNREGIEIRHVTGKEPVDNLIVRMRCERPGRRLVLNAHLDTFPLGDATGWTVPPLAGEVRGGRIYGRGISDMKAGLAATVAVLEQLWEIRDHLAGELILTLVGDEETGGVWGTKYVLENVPEASGDAMMNADAGSPHVVRFGEKGQMWIELRATGRSAHGAHVHLGVNAIDLLMRAIACVQELERLECTLPDDVARAIDAAAPVSEPISGAGEQRVLSSVTVNVGTIDGGTAVNIVPDRAVARLDVRFPPGLGAAQVECLARAAVSEIDGISLEVLNACEPNWTDPADEIVRVALKHAGTVVNGPVAANMRVGFSDARYYRQRGIPAIVYGPTPYNMAAADENVTIADLEAVYNVLGMCAFDYMSARVPGANSGKDQGMSARQ